MALLRKRRRDPGDWAHLAPRPMSEFPAGWVFELPVWAEALVLSHIIELPRDLRLPDRTGIFRWDEPPAEMANCDPSVFAALLHCPEETRGPRRPLARLVFRRTEVRGRLPLQAADQLFQDWERPLIPPAAWKQRTKVLRAAVKRGIEEPVTVVGASELIAAGAWPDTRDEQEDALDAALEAGLDYLNDLITTLGLVERDPSIPPVARGELPALCPVIIEVAPMPSGRRDGVSFLRQIHDVPPHFFREPRDTKPVEVAVGFLASAHAGDEPFFLFHELFQRALSALVTHRYAEAVVAVGTAVEVLIASIIREVSPLLGDSPNRLTGVQAAPLASQVRDHLSRYLDRRVDLADSGNFAGAWWQNGYAIRNDVVHRGRVPTAAEAQAVFDAAGEFALAVQEALESRAITASAAEHLGMRRAEE